MGEREAGLPGVDELVERASGAPGVPPSGALGDDDWREPLERLLAALESEAALSDLGRDVVTSELVDYLTTRFGILDERRRHPELAAAPVVAPIVVVGQARTGTTLLFDLLAQDPAMRAPLTWEVDRPLPPPQTATYHDDPRIEEVDAIQTGIDLVLPGFRAMHPLGARLGQECVRITGSAFRSMIFPTQYRVPSYARWLVDEADMAPAYRWHRMFLQHLQSRHPAPRWVLKSPGHIWCLGALVAEYPDALLVQTHRDPLRVVASLGSLVATLRSLASDETSVPEAATEFAELVLDGLDRSVTARDAGTVPDDRVVDVHYDALVADPLAAVARIYERFGLALTTDAETRMRAFLVGHGADRHGYHRYTFADTGLDAADLRARARRYQERFEVADEPLP